MIEIRCQKPSFFYDFKKKRTVMLKEKEPEKKEHYHVIYLRQLEQEKLEKEKRQKAIEKRRQALEENKLAEMKAIPIQGGPTAIRTSGQQSSKTSLMVDRQTPSLVDINLDKDNQHNQQDQTI